MPAAHRSNPTLSLHNHYCSLHNHCCLIDCGRYLYMFNHSLPFNIYNKSCCDAKVHPPPPTPVLFSPTPPLPPSSTFRLATLSKFLSSSTQLAPCRSTPPANA